MPVAIPFIAAAAGAAASAVIGGGVLGAVAAAGAALVGSAVRKVRGVQSSRTGPVLVYRPEWKG